MHIYGLIVQKYHSSSTHFFKVFILEFILKRKLVRWEIQDTFRSRIFQFKIILIVSRLDLDFRIFFEFYTPTYDTSMLNYNSIIHQEKRSRF